MEKRIWTKPEMNEFAFAANEYVAACEDTVNKFWKFICNFGGGKHYDIYAGKYDPNKNKYVNAIKSDRLTNLSYFHECDTVHYVMQEKGKDWTSYFEVGWADDDASLDVGDVTYDVYIWRGENKDNVHVTTQAGQEIQVVDGNFS